MTHTTKKGFTLVELIITMAIVVILASVTYVGFRNYVVKANLSKDMETITEINNVIRAQSGHESFDAPKDLMEARALIDSITNDRFTYESRVDGYHFWFHLGRLEIMLSTVSDMAKYSDATSLKSQNVLLSDETSRVNFSLLPEGFLYHETRPVLFLELEGSLIADAIGAFRNVVDLQSYQESHNTVNNANLDDISRTALSSLFSKTVFVTNNGNYATSEEPGDQIIFQNGIETVTNQRILLDETVTVIDESSPLIRMSQHVSVPTTVRAIMENSLNVVNPEESFAFEFDLDSDALLLVVEPAFTNAMFTANDDKYRIDQKTGLIKNDIITELTLSYKENFKVASFDLMVNEVISTGYVTLTLDQTTLLSGTNYLSANGSVNVSNKTLTYDSSDESVAIVNSDGTVDLFSTGSTILTATILGTDVSQSVVVTVVDETDASAPVTYDFKTIDIADFQGSSWYSQTSAGITSDYGVILIEHDNIEYDISINAVIDRSFDSTYGGYGILFDSVIDTLGRDSGYILQFDRGYNAIVVRPRVYGGERDTILRVDHDDNNKLPNSKQAAFWTEEHTLLLQVRLVDGMPTKKALTVYVDALKVIDNYVFDANVVKGTSVTGIRTWAVPTTIENMTIQGYDHAGEVADTSLSAIIGDLLEQGIFDGVQYQYAKSGSSTDSWSIRIEKYLETDSNALTYRNRYVLENPLATTYNQQAVINWNSFNINKEYDHPAFFITNHKDFSYDNILSFKNVSRLLGSIIIYKTDDRSAEIFAYHLGVDGTLGDLLSFELPTA